ncbi:Vitamin K-dependent gamma-carboxylase [Pedobacter steynii]|uniref:Vitamin K-dependent gamma-carboxylase n=1 Tax=Pedobacter steynii TaxID=430522 RepID=A0A1G9KDJ4_9SPHI|nr:HTTM domain-containing protein [Pedobacter steynii]NQX38525.1 HTTM domain-containing protein [Pedobacter steynii]SDL47950.1 Vitamin K-dependent gamma-carboxylase [Pedobacter steynii]
MKPVTFNHAIQLAVLRIGVALTVLAKIWVEFDQLDMLFSQHGIIQEVLTKPLDISYVISLPKVIDFFGIQNEHLFLTSLYTVFGLAACFLLLGFQTKISAFICLLIHLMVFNGYNLLAFGFDGFLFSLLFYTLIFPVEKVFSFDRLIKGSTEVIAPDRLNLYLRVLQIHLCIVYFTAGFSKFGGQEWMNGTAIWKAINQPQFYTELTPFVKSLASYPWISAVLTWGTLTIELFFPFLIWIRWGKMQASLLIGVIIMHVFIAAVMGLQMFAWIMIVFDLSAFGGVLFRKPNLRFLAIFDRKSNTYEEKISGLNGCRN